MAGDPIFSIRGLRCAYDRQTPVVQIGELDIPRGSFVGLLSSSGGGKSTVLESLGLMSHTLLPQTEIRFFPEVSSEGYDYLDLWQRRQEKLRSQIRGQHFSFIFQQTHLMPNFTAYENICISQMIQGRSQAASLQAARAALEQLGLSRIDQEKKVFELSGGEQQRVAFARAITPEFSVIFGDEPTGNLDPENADALMARLRGVIKEKGKTALIVSHDVQLISSYADMLVVLKKEAGLGQLSKDHIYHKETDGTWKNAPGKEIPAIVPEVSRLMKYQP
jgi:lipoprotein-releasing system ATP-binding protein